MSALSRNVFHLLLALVLAGLAASARPNPPNVLLILVDDLGYGDLSSYGATDLRTPHIDRLMDQSLRFNRFYANCTVCSPTRAALLTGRYPDLVGVPGVVRQFASNTWGYLDPSAITLPQILRQAEYHTAIVGKWHLGLEAPNLPNDRGFDFFHGFLGDMMDDYWTHLRGGVNWMRRNRQPIDPEGHATELFSDWAIDYLDTRREAERPFFLYLAYNAPHFPIQPPDDWLQRVAQRDPTIDEKRARNVAFVEHLDHHVGRVLLALRETGLADSTIVIFTSDNGGSLPHSQSNGPLRGGKQDHWEGGIRVPTCIRWPDIIQPRQTDQVAITMDLFPTICAMANLPVQHAIEGRSLLNYLLRSDASDLQDRHLIWMRREGGRRYQGRAYYAIRQGPWKYQQSSPFAPMQLFDIDSDPLETTPVQDRPDIVEQLQQALQRHIQDSGSIPWQP